MLKTAWFSVIFLFLTLSFNSHGQNQNVVDEIAKLKSEISSLSKLRQFEKAIESAKRLVIITESNFGPKHANFAETLVTLGFLYFVTNSPADSENHLRRAVEVFDFLGDSGKDDLLAAALEVLAKIGRNAGRYEESIDWLNRLVQIRIRSTGADSEKTSDAKWSLANTMYAFGKPERAFPLFRDVFNSTLARYGESPAKLLDPFTRCACTMRKAGFVDDALLFESKFGGIIVELRDLKRTALKLPFPDYPAVGGALKRERQVKVTVVVDEGGAVVFACAESDEDGFGFVNAAESAAYKAKFEPLRFGNELAKYAATVTYNFRRK